jgi:hypothetical protein
MIKVIVFSILFVPYVIFGQGFSMLSESFDSYNDGDTVSVVGVANGWGEYSGTGDQSCLVSDAQFLSSPHSGHVVNDVNTQTRATWTWTDRNSGRYAIEFNIFVPASSEGGYIGFHDSLMSEQPHSISILGDSILLFLDWDAFNLVQTDIDPGMWNNIKVVFDLDNSTSEIVVNGLSIDTTSAGTQLGTTFGASIGLGGVEFWSFAYNPFTGLQPPGEYYIDDLNVQDELATMGYGSQLSYSLLILPNPSNGQFAINFNDYSFDNAALTITNMMGSVVHSEELSAVTNTTKNFNLDLNSGVYFVRVADNNSELSTRIVIK